MLPAAVVDPVLHSLGALRLEPGDIVIDRSNSYYHDDIRRAGKLQAKGLHYRCRCQRQHLEQSGYCHMIGGEDGMRPPS